MVRTAPAPPARTACTRGRGGVSQSETVGQTASIQGETEGAESKEERKDEDSSKESKGQDKDEDSKSTSSEESETKEPSKPPAKDQVPTKPSQDDGNEGKEGTADDNDDDEDKLFPCKVDARRKVHKKGGRPRKGTTRECHEPRSASQMARAAGDFGTPRNHERQAMFVQAYKTLVSRMFVSLGLADDIINAIVDKQGYNTPHALSRLDKKGIEQLMNVIRKPGGMKDGTRNLRISVPLWSQELIMGACFALKHQRRCGEKFHPSLISLDILEELWLQQEIEDAHNNKVA